MKKDNNILLIIGVIIGIGILAIASYYAGYEKSKSEMDSLLMTMTLDSNFVTAGLYEELPNNVRRTMQFFLEDTPTVVNGVKLFAEVKYVTIGGEVVDIENGKIWNIIRKDKIFQRKFNENNKTVTPEQAPNSPFAEFR